jgi:hypothetical protein
MKKMILMAAMLMSMAAMAQEAVLTFGKTTHDFGKINEADGRVTTVFEFKNEGMIPLVLTNVKASCGCTSPNWTKEPVEPGQTGQITVTYNPSGRPGRFQKSITITSNASTEPVRIYIKGEVIPKPAAANYPHKIGELSVQKNWVNMGAVKKGMPKTVEIEYANTTDKAIKVDLRFDYDKQSYWAPLITATTVEPGKTGKLQVTLITEKCPVYGPEETKMYFVVNGKEHTADSEAIVLKADIKEDFSKMTAEEVQLAPIVEVVTVVNAGTAKAGKALKTKIGIKNAGINTLLIRRIYSNSPEIVLVPVKNVKSRKMEDLSLTINTTGMSAAQYSREVTIITNDPKRSVVKVKVNWVVE